MADRLDRALLLLNQGRLDLAEQELRGMLARDPDDASAHAVLALCLSHLKRFDDAADEAGRAIGLAPGFPLAHYALATIRYHQDRYKEAESALAEAIRLDPHDADQFALLASIRLEQRRPADALQAAEQGLAVDPGHVNCLNLRAMALVKLNRRNEAGAALQGALERSPENALSHANLGWTLLHQGDHRKALEHFREALRIDPELDWARAGIVEALKARHLVYRVMLRYFLWMARASDKVQWVVIVAIFFGPRLLGEIGRANPSFRPLMWVLTAAILGFVYLTWVADPLFNLLLRVNKFGRYALTRDQVRASNVVGLCVVGALVVPWPLLAIHRIFALMGLAYFLLMILPVSITFRSPAGWRRGLMGAYTAGLGLLGAAVLLLPLVASVQPRPRLDAWMMGHWPTLLGAFGVGVVASTWIGMGLTRWR